MTTTVHTFIFHKNLDERDSVMRGCHCPESAVVVKRRRYRFFL